MEELMQNISFKMQKALDILISDLNSVRTGRVAPSLIENIEVNVYGGSARMKILELATISISDSQTLVVTPFDSLIIDEIRKGLLEANTGLTPNSDGHIIRINIPPLTTERREELIHLLKQKLENGRILIRQVRQIGLKDLKNEGNLSEDEITHLEKEIQGITDKFINKIDEMGRAKEEELITI